jgi:hypothetical protein
MASGRVTRARNKPTVMPKDELVEQLHDSVAQAGETQLGHALPLSQAMALNDAGKFHRLRERGIDV